MRFVDLFAGLGGFHVALRRFGHDCVFACELETHLRALYQKNFGVQAAGDIREVEIEEIPDHDILCAGFPCQPFSKAGSQLGRDCVRNGTLFDNVVEILKARQPEYFLLENVPNLLRHDNQRTWQEMKARLKGLEYDILDHRLSPHQFGIPQIRERLYIVGCRSGLGHFEWPTPLPKSQTSIISALDKSPADARGLSPQVIKCLEVWQEFIELYPKDQHLPSFPIWSMEFGATYPYRDQTPFNARSRALCSKKGSHGLDLGSLPPGERMKGLPSYARTEVDTFPHWKVEFIRQNRELYERNARWIDPWMNKIRQFPSSLQKLEWNCKGGKRNIWDYIIQFRASGVRVKRPSHSPSLIAMTSTQVPIIAWERRYMTPRECARLQSLQELKYLPERSTIAFKALGNAINTDVVELILQALIPGSKKHAHGKMPISHVGKAVSDFQANVAL